MGKGQIDHNEQFHLFPTAFVAHLENFTLFSPNLMEESKFVVWERYKKCNQTPNFGLIKLEAFVDNKVHVHVNVTRTIFFFSFKW